jgi:hypothetical protein
MNPSEIYGDPKQPQAIVIRRDARVDEIEFFSPESYPQQVGLMARPKGYIVEAHSHKIIRREIDLTQEVLLIRSGSCEVKLFNEDGDAIFRITLLPGDVILLAHGAHQVEMLADCEILEIKQGPYLGPNDKFRVKVQS